MSEEGIGEHRCKGIENDEAQNETIYSANSGMGSANSGTGNANNCTGSQTNYKNTTYDIPIREITEVAKVGSTTDDISIVVTIGSVAFRLKFLPAKTPPDPLPNFVINPSNTPLLTKSMLGTTTISTPMIVIPTSSD
jgi:hypothetical protein